MQHSPTLRRFRRVITAYVRRTTGAITAHEALSLLGVDHATAARYAGPLTRVAAGLGVTPAARIWTQPKPFRRHYGTAAFTDFLGLIRALMVYTPGGKPKLLKNGRPSKSKAERERAAKAAAWRRALFGPFAAVVAA